MGASTTGAGLPGPYTREAGMLGYNEVSTESVLLKSLDVDGYSL